MRRGRSWSLAIPFRKKASALCEDNRPTYYAAFVDDPDGNFEVVTHSS